MGRIWMPMNPHNAGHFKTLSHEFWSGNNDGNLEIHPMEYS